MVRDKKFIIGIDEVGRGALAGTVTVAAVALPRNFQFPILNFQLNSKYKISKLKLRDSKRLTPKRREVWFRYVNQQTTANNKRQRIFYAVASVTPKVIDKINISNAADLAATRALEKLITNYQLPITKTKVFLDGGLYIKELRIKNKELRIKGKTIIKGDEKIPAIALASIMAKVTRDRYMKKFHRKYPEYDFINNVGYGTKKHIKAVRKYGLSLIHRRSFKINKNN
ncbi:ribonuclease HII [Candidatus Wolfebacteria bacterium]|nr:ribonuclease HII [Candidatus Wolfebacteria bacterium]